MMKLALLSLCTGATLAFVAPRGAYHTSTTSLSMSSALIVQNKGGGHGELGYQLAKTLLGNEKITSITILQDEACKETAEPFKSYASDLPSVTVIKAPLGNDEAMTAESLKSLLSDSSSFDYIWDNASKGAESGVGKAIIDCAKEWNTKLLTYVSSAGVYQPNGIFPMPETTPVKESAGQVKYEQYAKEVGLPFCSFRPQYIYGPKSNKYDYIDWYFDRITRDLPLVIPGDGTQKVSLTNSEDVASILASVLDHEDEAVAQGIFNCGTDQLVTYNEVAELCAQVAGKDKADIYYYNADEFGKANFPFRMTDFYVSPDTVKAKLGWEGAKHSLKDDLQWYYEGYKANRAEKKVDFGKDWEIVVGSKPSLLGDESVYDKYDPVVIDMAKAKMLELDLEQK
ncbi:NAD dependent epimerase [Fragilaria crotonensis]|nr:NAD dependent epimerase [Fragilaria crotonensis]